MNRKICLYSQSTTVESFDKNQLSNQCSISKETKHISNVINEIANKVKI